MRNEGVEEDKDKNEQQNDSISSNHSLINQEFSLKISKSKVVPAPADQPETSAAVNSSQAHETKKELVEATPNQE